MFILGENIDQMLENSARKTVGAGKNVNMGQDRGDQHQRGKELSKKQKMQVGTSGPVRIDPVSSGREHEIASDSATYCT